MTLLFKGIGAVGMLLISYGIINKNNLTRNGLFILGGVMLLIYSIYLRDPIFIPLQIIFTGASLYEIYKIKNKPHN